MEKLGKYIIILLSGCVIACSDYLDIQPLDSFTNESVFSDPTLTEAYVNARYSEIKVGITTNDYAHATGIGLRYISDEAYHNFNFESSYSFNRGEITPDQVGGQYNTWRDYYVAIKNCNIFFENIGLLKTDQQTINRLLGEVTYLRAFFYADLVSRFGGVPIIEHVFGLNDDMMTARNSYEECVSFIVNELDKAASLLQSVNDAKNYGRATKGAALALKSRVLLYAASPFWNTSDDRAKWLAAANAAKAVIDLTENGTPVFELNANYKELFLSNKSREIIFMRQFNMESGHNIDKINTPNGFTGWSMTCVLQDLVDAYEMADGSMPPEEEYASGNTPWQNREPRFYASIVCDGQLYRGREVEFFISSTGDKSNSGIDSEQSYIEEWNASKSHYAMRKFMDESLTDMNTAISTQPWIYIRLGEMYLNYAEAMYHLGDEATARIYINKIRERARGGQSNVLPDITATGNALLEKIRHERRIELAFEDHRYFDVRRWKIADITENKPARKITIVRDDVTREKTYKIEILQERKFLSQHYLMPIPRTEMQRVPLLEQNPGYN
ncbi:MAG: RagB/SusD family nutrient uptake outer membrane protein [Tannerella sp.]|jgi:hypothetical protein|nr:RagB/SusD family nutrient uptake outer membrane protein [Tannerella sp.]